SQNSGRGDVTTARAYAENSARLGLVLGLIYGSVLLTMAGPLISLLQVTEPTVFASACAYLRIVALGIPLTYISAAITGSFNGAGNSRLSFLANATGLIVNMVLDPLFILVFGWGVQGAAIATLIAQGVVMSLFIYFAKRHSKRPFDDFRLFGAFDREKVRQILRWSLPVAVESAAFTMLAMTVTSMISAWYGETAVAVQRVGSQIESLSWMIAGGFSSAVTAFVGQNFGARKWERIRRGYRISLAVLLVWEVFVILAIVLGGRFFFSLFLREPPEILDMGATYLRILAYSQIFMAFEAACSGTFRGLGQTLPPSISSISSNLIRPLLCWFFSQRIGFGLNGLWMGITVSAAVRGTLMLIWYTIYERRIPAEDGVELEAYQQATAL
ncbi:MAG: MATE family efflux transporter, partial [Firmicutes bacterium]|nr:MATE family efflux transporter [Bacillota bacterium]